MGSSNSKDDYSKCFIRIKSEENIVYLYHIYDDRMTKTVMGDENEVEFSVDPRDRRIFINIEGIEIDSGKDGNFDKMKKIAASIYEDIKYEYFDTEKGEWEIYFTPSPTLVYKMKQGLGILMKKTGKGDNMMNYLVDYKSGEMFYIDSDNKSRNAGKDGDLDSVKEIVKDLLEALSLIDTVSA